MMKRLQHDKIVNVKWNQYGRWYENMTITNSQIHHTQVHAVWIGTYISTTSVLKRPSVYSLQLSELGTRLSEQIQFDTVRQNNKRIVLCIDYSTSMNEVVGATTKYRQVIQAATQYVKGLSINTHIALVGFSRKPQDWIVFVGLFV